MAVFGIHGFALGPLIAAIFIVARAILSNTLTMFEQTQVIVITQLAD